LSGETFGSCCGRYLSGNAQAPTAERLMRSRFSAFALGDSDYLLETWHPDRRPRSLELDPEQRWTRLDILRTERGGMLDDRGVVEFRAHYRVGSVAGSQHELSSFVRENGRWYYVDGSSP
jgi:SEC-C motif-containing protein